MKLRALLVDDEEPARDRLGRLLSEFEDVEVAGTAGDGEEALRKISDLQPDLVFLDIEMPGMTGMQVVASLDPPRPRVVFCTAYDQYAIRAFEHHAVDYLLKPLKRDRVAKTLRRVRESMVEPARLLSEIRHASQTQVRLMSPAPVPGGSLEVSGGYQAASEVGGDYYDFLPQKGGRLGIAVGDVSGKGLYAGLLMASLQARVQSLASIKGKDLAGLMGEVNEAVHSSTDSNRYATLFYGRHVPDTRELSYVNAGHEPPMLFAAGSPARPPRRLESTGIAVGLMEGSSYEVETVTLDSGDLLLAFTDGLVEATNEEGEEFGRNRIESFVARHRKVSARQLRDGLLAEVLHFQGERPQRDDITVVVVRVP